LKQRSKRKNRKPSSRSHAVKTWTEKEEYDQKVRLVDTGGGTKEDIPSRTSTLSIRSIYGGSESAGISDRDPIKPPLPSDRFWKWVKRVTMLLTCLVIVGAAFRWVANVNNQVSFNEKQINQLNTNFKEVDSKRESLNTRLARLEQWKDVINDDLKQIKADIRNEVSTEQIDLKLLELEQRVLKELDNRETKTIPATSSHLDDK
jgi:hypothetical protein